MSCELQLVPDSATKRIGPTLGLGGRTTGLMSRIPLGTHDTLHSLHCTRPRAHAARMPHSNTHASCCTSTAYCRTHMRTHTHTHAHARRQSHTPTHAHAKYSRRAATSDDAELTRSQTQLSRARGSRISRSQHVTAHCTQPRTPYAPAARADDALELPRCSLARPGMNRACA